MTPLHAAVIGFVRGFMLGNLLAMQICDVVFGFDLTPKGP